MIKVNEIVFSVDKYNGNRAKMYEAITKQLMLLMENDYTCKIYDDDVDIIVIQYEHNNRRENWGGPELCWLYPEQVEILEDIENSITDSLTAASEITVLDCDDLEEEITFSAEVDPDSIIK